MSYGAEQAPAAPVAWVTGADERLYRFFEIELAHLGLVAVIAPPDDRALALIVADADAVPIDTLPRDCPLLAYGYTPAQLPEERGIFLRRPFPLPDLEVALRRLSAPVTTTAAPLGRTHGAEGSAVSAADALVLDEATASASVGGRRVELTPAEWAILHSLCAHRGEPVSREELSALLGGGGNSVDVYICHLRRKIEKPLGRRMIGTVRGKGYVLE